MSSASVPLSNTLLYIQHQLIRYVHSCFLIFGVTGCCLNILLLSRRQFRTSSCCTYLLAMNVAMVVYLIIAIGTYLYTLDHGDPSTVLLAVCKLRPYILQSSAMIYRWCLTAACFDRYVLSAINVRLRNLAKIHIARRVIGGIILIWLVLPIYILILYKLRGNVCGLGYTIIGSFYHSIYLTIGGGVLPVVIMMTCSLLIHRNLVLKQQRRQQLNGNQEHTTRRGRILRQSRRDQQVLFMLLVQISVYGILIIPLLSSYFYSAITLNVLDKSPDRIAIERFMGFMAELIIHGFPVSSFYLYTIASQIFRSELMKMIHAAITCQCISHPGRIEPMTNENSIRTTTEHTRWAKSIPPPCYFNRENLQCTIATARSADNLNGDEIQ